jgi:hypothetical protein
VNTDLPDTETWEKAVRESKLRIKKSAAKREEDQDFEQKRLHLAPSDSKKRRDSSSGSSSSSSSSYNTSSACSTPTKKIPSLLDIDTVPVHSKGLVIYL